MEKQNFDCIVIGSGPGGYVAAIKAAQNGLSTALVEAQDLGGTCLNRGCIPSKALIANAQMLKKMQKSEDYGIHAESLSFDYSKMAARKDKVVKGILSGLSGLIKSNKIQILKGYGKLVSPNEVKVVGESQTLYKAQTIILATGSEPREIPSLPFDQETIHDSTSILNLKKLPKKLVIIGGGVIGCEFACMHRALGVDVTIVELLPSLIPAEGAEIANALEKAFKQQGIEIRTNTMIKKVEKTESGLTLYDQDDAPIQADMALVAVGRTYNTDNIGLESSGVSMNADGSIPVNDRMQTNVPHIFAIGDITAKWLLAHVASHQGIVAAENAAGHQSKMDYNAVPSVIFTTPEIATVGLTLDKAKEQGFSAKIGKFPFAALGKSKAVMETDGFAQVVVEAETKQILGAQVVGAGAANLIATMTLAIRNELTLESITETIHAHPTQAEAWMEAAFMAGDLPLHFPPKN